MCGLFCVTENMQQYMVSMRCFALFYTRIQFNTIMPNDSGRQKLTLSILYNRLIIHNPNRKKYYAKHIWNN